MHMEATIEVTGLRKRFGPAVALDGMSFTVLPGEVTGFVGPNGAGKSTTMRVILGLDTADAGSALVGGQPYRSLRHPLSHVGALLDAAALQPSRSARNHLLWLAHSQGLTAKRVDEVIGQAGLASAARRKAGGYSLGMRQRLGIAAALLGDPPVIMLDEPFNGMDPEGIVWMRGLLRSLAAQGRAVLVSSHLMSELENTADQLVVVGRGKVIADTSVADLIAAASSARVTLRTTAWPEAMTVLANTGATVAAAGRDTLTIAGLATDKIVALLGENAVPFAEVSAHRATLEEAYMELTRDAVEFRATAAEEVLGVSSPGATARRWRDDHRHHHAVPLGHAGRPRWLCAAAARGVDQVPDGARLGHRLDSRGAGNRAPRAVRRGEQSRFLQRSGLQSRRSGGAGRRGCDRQLLLRAPAARRKRQHHRADDRTDRREHLA